MDPMPPDPNPEPFPVGPPLGQVLDVARAARLSVMLIGRHGIGKSEYLDRYATERGLRPFILDLSLLEATDLTGMPYLAEGVTRFAPPSTLPGADAGPSLLVLEELNRCDRSVRQPCLQLLTARRLNDYRLPEDCFLTACINPPDVGYDVDELDPALSSRFVLVHVAPDRAAWLEWARSSDVPPPLLAFVERHPQVFEKTPPRSWTLAARLAEEATTRGWDHDRVERLLRTLLPPIAARAYSLELRAFVERLPSAEELVLDASTHRETIRTLVAEGRLDAVRYLLEALALYLEAEGACVLQDPALKAPVIELVKAAPRDLRRRLEKLLK